MVFVFSDKRGMAAPLLSSPPSTSLLHLLPQPAPSLAGECGLAGPDPKIVGGQESTPHAFPWMAAITIDEKYFCGGTLISDE